MNLTHKTKHVFFYSEDFFFLSDYAFGKRQSIKEIIVDKPTLSIDTMRYEQVTYITRTPPSGNMT